MLIHFSRHPLQELTVASYIPNDVNLCGGYGARQAETTFLSSDRRHSSGPSMLLLTGPNFSGKSVYMKQVSFQSAWKVESDIDNHEKVALIVYLAHIGR